MSAIPNRAPSTIYSLRQNIECGYIRTESNDLVSIVLPAHPGTLWPVEVVVDRKDARLLAKRLNQCLDETRR